MTRQEGLKGAKSEKSGPPLAGGIFHLGHKLICGSFNFLFFIDYFLLFRGKDVGRFGQVGRTRTSTDGHGHD